jgi:hypothetical protein
MENLIKYSNYVFVLYLIISANFLANLFNCRVQYLLSNNMYIKHLLGFFTLLFFIIIVNSETKNKDIIFISIGIYLLFIITAKIDFNFWIIFIVLLSLIYILEIYKNEKEDNTTIGNIDINNIQYSLIIFNIFIIIVGFLVYLGKKKFEYKENFDYTTFLFGKNKCANNAEGGKNLNIIQSLSYVLK